MAAADQGVHQVGDHGFDAAVSDRRNAEVRRCDHRDAQPPRTTVRLFR